MPLDPPNNQPRDFPSNIAPATRQFSLRKLLGAIALFGLVLAPFANFGAQAAWPVLFISLVASAYYLAPNQSTLGSTSKFQLVRRLAFVASINALFVLIFFPYGGSQPPSSSLMTGPLWLFGTRSVEDKVVGAIWAAVPLGLMNVFVFAPSVRTSVFLVAGLILWIGAAIYLSMLYAA